MKAEGKPILIVFEGVDKSGKTTLKDTFNKKTNFSYVVLDRLTTSSKIYNNFFDRDRLEYYNRFERSITKSFDVLIVLCECDTDLIVNRLAKANEVLPEQLKDIDKVKMAFRNEIENSFTNFISIDTTRNIDECVNDIITRVNEMEKSNGEDKDCV